MVLSAEKYTKYIPRILIVSAFVLSYVYFIQYTPSDLNLNVKSAKSSKPLVDKLNKQTQVLVSTYPTQAKSVGVDEIKGGHHITVRVPRDVAQAALFYKNIFTVEGWRLKSESAGVDEHVLEFKKENERATISVSKDAETGESIVGLTVSSED